MTKEQIAGVVRAIVAAVGGYLVGKGYLEASSVEAVAGAFATIATAVWSVRSKE